MEAEIIAVGTELLLGNIVDTNTPYIARELAALGINVHALQTVGDNKERLDAAITLAESRADLIILSGGLGPTPDDLTKQTLADHLGLSLVTDEVAQARLDAWATQSQTVLTSNNRVQAQLPETSEPLNNPVGLAVGAFLTVGPKHYVTLPGPPRELTAMVNQSLRPLLASSKTQILVSEMLHFYGITESKLADVLAPIFDAQTNPTVAPYISPDGIILRVSAKAADEKTAEQLIAAMRAKILALIGEFYYGSGDDLTLAAAVVAQLERTRTTVTAAESLTAGAFQAELGTVAGVSEFFKGGFVTYSNETKASLLDLDAATITADGAVSETTALAMARAAKQRIGSDWALSFTGVAGPGANEGQAAGTVWLGLAKPDGSVETRLLHVPGSRNEVRARTVKTGLMWLYQTLSKI